MSPIYTATEHKRTRVPGLIDAKALQPVFTVVELNSTPSYVNNSDLSSKTLSHTIATGDNQCLVVIIKCNQNRYPTTVKWDGSGGTALTRGYYNVGDSTFGDNEIWYLLSPSTGTKDVYVAYNDTFPYSTIGAFVLKNVNQTTPLTGGNRATATGSVTVSSSSSSMVVASLCYWDNTSNYATPTTGQTEMWDTTGDGAWKGEGSYKQGSSSVTLTWTDMMTTYMHILACSFDVAT